VVYLGHQMAGGVQFRRASEWARYLTTWTDWTTCEQQQPVSFTVAFCLAREDPVGKVVTALDRYGHVDEVAALVSYSARGVGNGR